MALFEFKCNRCNKIIEKLCTFAESNENIYCTEYIIPKDTWNSGGAHVCNGQFEKQISLSSFSLKGDCWSKDNYK